jgi:SAM-dependent methyltransferase
VIEGKSNYYDGKYLSWQRDIGEFGGWADHVLFAPFVKQTDTVVDFGCGVGALLKGLDVGTKIGVEINTDAIERIRTAGIEHHLGLDSISTASIDVAVSNHALEHCDDPLSIVRDLYRILRPGGRLVIVVPCESVRLKDSVGDINQHLFTWSPVNLGNLLRRGGFEQVDSHALPYVWPPKIYRTLAKVGGRRLFSIAARLYGWMCYLNAPGTRFCQVRAIGTKGQR